MKSSFFKRSVCALYTKAVKPLAYPAIGSIYRLQQEESDPFSRGKKVDVMVKDVKEGHVLYSMGNIFDNESMSLSHFLSIYKPIPANEENYYGE